MDVKIIKHNGRYFSNYVNNRRSVYSFTDIKPAHTCCMYLANFKSRYSEYPYIINNNTPINVLKLIHPSKRIPVKYVLISCRSADIGLILIDNFNYSFTDHEINIKFLACDLFTNEAIHYNHIELIN